jgi:hypothetical protein
MVIMIDLIIRVAILGATGFLFGIILLSYSRMPNRKMGFITIGFGVLFIHAILLMPEVMFTNYTMGFTENIHLLIHLIALIFITLGILKD